MNISQLNEDNEPHPLSDIAIEAYFHATMNNHNGGGGNRSNEKTSQKIQKLKFRIVQ